MSLKIYLDQNKWIDIARAFYGREDGKDYIEIMSLLTKLSESQKIILPISLTHYIETARPENQSRRERLAKFMISLSKCNSILPFHAVREYEVKNAVLKKINKPPIFDIENAVIGKGLAFTTGGEIGVPEEYKHLKKEIKELESSEATTFELIVNSFDRDLAKEFKDEDIKLLTEYEKNRKENQSKYSEEECESLAIFSIVRERILPILVPFVKEIGLTVEKFCDLFITRKDWVDFFYSIPTLDIWINLNHLKEMDKNRPLHRNDTNDIAFLTMAIPYCDIVVAEKYWIAMLKRLKYDERYGVKLYEDINDLKADLCKL